MKKETPKSAPGRAKAAPEPPWPGQCLGQLLRKHRKACGLTQAFMAEHLFVTVRTVKRWESGRSVPRGNRLEYLLTYYEIPLQEVIQAKRRLYRMSDSGLDRFTDLRV